MREKKKVEEFIPMIFNEMARNIFFQQPQKMIIILMTSYEHTYYK